MAPLPMTVGDEILFADVDRQDQVRQAATGMDLRAIGSHE